jgi:hypothetical protein
VTVTSSWQPKCFGSDDSKQSPTGEPLKDSEENEELGKLKVTDGDDLEVFAVVFKGFELKSRNLVLRAIGSNLTLRLYPRGSGYCRAPPAALV